MNHAALVSVGIAALTFARTHAELDQWLKDNMEWIRAIKAKEPTEYNRFIEAGREKRTALGPRE